VSGERFKDISYVDLGATGDTDMKIWKAKLDELLDEQENSFSRGRNARGIGTFIEGVDYKIDRILIWDPEHLFQALPQEVITGLFRAILMSFIKT
jgi:hypothetical protein